jgi:3-methyladenine DNA glycosylase AlkD
MTANTAARAKEILAELKSMADPKVLVQEQRLGIKVDHALGISVWDLRKFAKELGHDQQLAEELWKTGIREARLLAGYVADPQKISEKTIEKWVLAFDSWDQVDQISDAFLFSPFAYRKAIEWSKRKEEFVKRTAFVLMAGLAFYDKEANDAAMEKFLPIIVREADDERNFVKKAVNWALRNIGKRNAALSKKAIAVAKQLATDDSKSAQWIGKDALRELTSDKVQAKLKKKVGKSTRE